MIHENLGEGVGPILHNVDEECSGDEVTVIPLI